MPRAEPAIRLDAGLLARWPLPVDDHGDKHVRGTVLVLGGGPSTLGAVLLAGSAALRMGAGRLQIGVAAPAPAALGVAVPEAMVVELPTHRDGRLRPHRAAAAVRSLIEGADAILVGPGMLAGPATLQFVGDVLAAASPTAIVVLDAAALPAASHTDADTLARVRSRVALTPNRQEAQALVATGADEPHDELLHHLARSLRMVTSSFGTVVSGDGRCWDAGQGGPGLGTSGSGDVLAGLVAGAAARCGDVAQAACWATYVHTMIGRRLATRMGPLGFIARELVDEVPAVMAAVDGG